MNNIKYVYLPKEIIKSKQLTASDKLYACYLFHKVGWETKAVIPTNVSVADKLGITSRTIINSRAKLIDSGFLRINDDNTYDMLLNNILFTNKSDLSNKEKCNAWGDFIKVPTFSLILPLSPAERIAYMMLFDFYFDIDGSTFRLKKNSVIISSVATYYNIDKSSLQKLVASIRDKGFIDFKTVIDHGRSKNIGFKFFVAEQKWIIHNGKEVNEDGVTIKTREETISKKQRAVEEEQARREEEAEAIAKEDEETDKVLEYVYGEKLDLAKRAAEAVLEDTFNNEIPEIISAYFYDCKANYNVFLKRLQSEVLDTIKDCDEEDERATIEDRWDDFRNFVMRNVA